MSTYFVFFQLQRALNQNLLMTVEIRVKFCISTSHIHFPPCTGGKLSFLRHQMKMAVFFDAVWAGLGSYQLITHCSPVDLLPLSLPRQARNTARGGFRRGRRGQIPRSGAGARSVEVELGTYFVQEESVAGHQRAREVVL